MSVRLPRAGAAALVAVAVAAAALLSAHPAYADGDPASDVLYTQWTFVPADAGIPAADAALLAGYVREARRAGFPVKVAVITSSYDLGSITELWHRPQTYARFLGTELRLAYHGRLLVVMPNGFGIYHDGHDVTRERATLRALSIHGGSAQLATAAATALRSLAADAGHRLAAPATAAPRAPDHAGVGVGEIVALALGALVIAGSWVVSLRLRPVRIRLPGLRGDG